MNQSSTLDLVKRYCLFMIGLLIAAFGVALSTKASLGTSPVASVPYSISLMSNLFSFGGWLNLWSVIQISVQVLLLRNKCNPFEIAIQTILAFAYGYLTNFAVYLIRGFEVNGYIYQFILMIISCFVLGLGIWIQLKGNVAMLPGEAMNRAIASVTNKTYGDVKVVFDVLYIVVSAILGMVFLGGLKGVREGSIIAALLIGNIVKVYNKIYDQFIAK